MTRCLETSSHSEATCSATIVDSITSCTDPEQFEELCSTDSDYTLESCGRDGCHALGAAAICGNLELIRYIAEKKKGLLDRGNCLGHTPLFTAVCNDQFDAVKLLIELGAGVNIATNAPLDQCKEDVCRDGATPLWMAARKSDRAMMHLLLQNGAVLGELPLDREQQERYNTVIEENNKQIEDILLPFLRIPDLAKITREYTQVN